MNYYAAATDYLRRRSVSADAHAVGMAILALADRVGALTVAVRETRDPVVCPGCSTAHRDSKTMCDTCASEGPA